MHESSNTGNKNVDEWQRRKGDPVSFAWIVRDPQLQMRASGLDAATVEEYAQAIRDANGQWPFPPAAMVNAYLCDGWHRVAAAKLAGLKTVPAIVIRDQTGNAFTHALRVAAGANATHGLPRTNDDKRHAVDALLETLPLDSDREIARLAKVSHPFVASRRATRLETLPLESDREELARQSAIISRGLDEIRAAVQSDPEVADQWADYICGILPELSRATALGMVMEAAQ